MSSLKFPFLFIVHCSLFIVFSIYTYTQVDLNLTLSSNATYQSIQNQLTQIGYFNRPLSTTIFLTLLFFLSTIYYLLSTRFEKWKFSQKKIWTLIFSGSIVLSLSYPAFAHDIFNYLFDARILVKYHQSPWATTPLHFPADEWTRFMRWTHVSSVYPPGWIVTSILFYLLGFGKFTLTLLSFKILGLVAFLGSSWLMLRLAGRKAWVLWSFNPMVLIESLSSVHNEIVMAFFTLLAFWLYRNRDKVRPLHRRSDLSRRMSSYLCLIWAGLVKYSSFLLLPFLSRPVWAAVAAWVGALVFFYVREINPWYILLPVAISFMSNNKVLTQVALIASIAVMYRYYPCVAIFSC